MDNLHRKFLQDSYHRICTNYAQIAAYIYDVHHVPTTVSRKIEYVVKDLHPENSPLSVLNFRNIIRYQSVAPQLARLLGTQGMWTTNLEKVYYSLGKCRVESVCYRYTSACSMFCSPMILIGDRTCCTCVCRPGGGHK